MKETSKMTAVFLTIFVTLQVLTHTSGASAKHRSDDKLLYPGPVKEYPTQNRYGGGEDEIPDECKDKNYCTIKPPDYPQQKFNNMIKNRLSVNDIERVKRSSETEGNSKKSANSPKIPLSQPDTIVSDLIDKQGDPDEVDNCESIVEFEPLFKVKEKRGTWRTVVQAPDKNFVQRVRLETCRETGKTCFDVFPKLPAYTTFCKQKFTTWKFVVDSDDPNSVNKTQEIPIDLPTCCSCFYKANY